jgi:hypothetical protein
MQVPADKLAYWDDATHSYIAQPGTYDIRVGASSADIRVRDQITVTSPATFPP